MITKNEALDKLYDIKLVLDEAIAALEHTVPEDFQDEDEKAMYAALGDDGMTPYQTTTYDNALAHVRESI